MAEKREPRSEVKPYSGRAPVILSGAACDSILESCCARRGAGTLVFPSDAHACEAAFAALGEEHLVMAAEGGSIAPVRPQSACFVVFIVEGRGVAAITSVVGKMVEGDGPADLILARPAHLIAAEMRRWFRVPILPEIGLQVWLTVEGVAQEALCRDISMGGLLVEFRQSSTPALAVDENVPVYLRTKEAHFDLEAQVRRRNGAQYGLAVPEQLWEDRAWRKFVSAIERAYLQQRSYAEAEE